MPIQPVEVNYTYNTLTGRRTENNTLLAQQRATMERYAAEMEQIYKNKTAKAASLSIEDRIKSLDESISSHLRSVRAWHDKVADIEARYGRGSPEYISIDHRATYYVRGHKDSIKNLRAKRESLLKPKEPDICDIIREESK